MSQIQDSQHAIFYLSVFRINQHFGCTWESLFVQPEMRSFTGSGLPEQFRPVVSDHPVSDEPNHTRRNKNPDNKLVKR